MNPDTDRKPTITQVDVDTAGMWEQSSSIRMASGYELIADLCPGGQWTVVRAAQDYQRDKGLLARLSSRFQAEQTPAVTFGYRQRLAERMAKSMSSHEEATLNWTHPDSSYSQILGRSDVSSRHGLIQGMIAQDVLGIPYFDPNNTAQLALFDQYRQQHPVEYADQLSALNKWFNSHNRSQTVINGDLMDHFDAYRVPKDLPGFLAAARGLDQDWLNRIKYAFYR